jgi:hypothetical protein
LQAAMWSATTRGRLLVMSVDMAISFAMRVAETLPPGSCQFPSGDLAT